MDKNKTNNIPNVFNFSGGKTSAYMTIQGHQKGDIVIFCDTGREHPATYKFINDFEAFENINVIRKSFNNSVNPFEEMLKKRHYNIIPNRSKRFCTVELKIKVAKRYLRSIGIQKFNNYIGFRFDEQNRIKKRVQPYKKVIDKFPLNDNKITKEMINKYWETKPYNLEIPPILGNCTLCFMKGENAIIAILREFPELADDWIKDEVTAQKNGKYGGHTYFKNKTIEQLRDYAKNNLFKHYPLEDILPTYNCVCGV